MKKKIQNVIKTKYILPSIFIILISILVSIPTFFTNINIQVDDGIQHLYRIIGTHQSIKEGQIFPVIMSKLCNNFGYSWNLFYSPITAYTPLIFKFFGFSYTMCMKLFMLFISILTGFSMYFFMKKFLTNKLEENKIELISILASILYILFPYRLNDMYLRVAISELTSFIFLPIIFNGLYTIVNLNKKSYLLILGSSMMILTHSMLSVYVAIFCIIYLIVNIKNLNKKNIIALFINLIIILLLTMFYFIPLLESKASSSYAVFNQNHMIRWDAMINLKPSVLELLMPIKGRQIYSIGILNVIGTILSLTIVCKIKDKKNYILFLVLGLVSTIMTLNFFPFEKLPNLFTMMQFSFRMLEFSGFFLVIVSSIAIIESFDKINIYTVLTLTTITFILTLFYIPFLRKGEYYKEEDLIKSIPVTENTLRVHAGCASFEYLPSNALNNRKYIENRKDIPILLNTKDYTITEYYKSGTICNFYITINSIDAEINEILELPYIYYIGYTVTYEDEEGSITNLETFETENGFLGVNLKENKVKVRVNYTGTILMKISYIISLITLGILIIYILNSKYKNK